MNPYVRVELVCSGSLVDDHFDVIENTGYIKDAAEDC